MADQGFVQADPYTRIATEIKHELATLAQEQASGSTVGTASAVEALAAALGSVDEQLTALEAAVEHMVEAPARFNLPRMVAYQRQAEVQSLRYQYQHLQRVCSGPAGGSHQHRPYDAAADAWEAWPASTNASSSSNLHEVQLSKLPTTAAKAPHFPTVTSGGQAKGGIAVQSNPANGSDTSWNYLRDQQQVMLQQQDEALEDISIHIGRVKETGMAMHEELGEQDRLLGDLQTDADISATRIQGARARVLDVIKRARNDRQLLLIVVLTVILVILLILAVA